MPTSRFRYWIDSSVPYVGGGSSSLHVAAFSSRSTWQLRGRQYPCGVLGARPLSRYRRSIDGHRSAGAKCHWTLPWRPASSVEARLSSAGGTLYGAAGHAAEHRCVRGSGYSREKYDVNVGKGVDGSVVPLVPTSGVPVLRRMRCRSVGLCCPRCRSCNDREVLDLQGRIIIYIRAGIWAVSPSQVSKNTSSKGLLTLACIAR